MSAPYIVTGANTGGAYPRLEIAELVKQPMQFSLFVQAMANIQKEGYKPVAASWQELGGIHGLPYSRWSGDPAGPDQPESQEWEGYCYHSTTIFPTWHRVLMLAVEQSVSNEAVLIYKNTIENDSAVSADEKSQWHAAAVALRFPYWDWSVSGVATSGVPDTFTENELTILKPNNKNIAVDNPLRTYNFHPIPEGAQDIQPWLPGVDFADWTRTYRWATGEKNPKDNVAKLNSVLKNGLGEDGLLPVNINAEKLARIFSFPPVAKEELQSTYWDYFATTGPQAPQPLDFSTIGSLEDPHNMMHLDIGGTGDMAYNELAGFDPIFYMHHCNIDRIFALWEYCYPQYWMGSGYYKDGELTPFSSGENGTYQQDPYTNITSQTLLAPFRKDVDTYWTSDDVRLKSGLENLQYTYPPLTLSYQPPFSPSKIDVTIDITQSPSDEHRLQCIAALQGYYSSVSVRALEPGADVFAAHAALQPSLFVRSNLALPPPSALALTANTPLESTHTPAPGRRVFTVVASLPQFAFHGSHKLKLYVNGELVNELSVFSRILPERCGNCTARARTGDARVQAALTLPQSTIDRVLTAAGLNTETATDEDVINAVSRSISARIVAPDGTLLAQASHVLVTDGDEKETLSEGKMPSLDLHSARVLVPKQETHAQWFADNWEHHGEVLKNKWVSA